MYKLSEDTFDEKEINAVNKLLASKKRLSYGANVKKIEKKIADIHNRKYCIMTNSGSSANLLGIAGLIYDNKFNFNKNDEVIVPSLSWGTTYSPLIQMGLKLVFVDIDKDSLNISINNLKRAITKKTKAIFAVNILGLSCEYKEILDLCKRNKIFLFEDNCESLLAKYNGKLTGTFGIFSTLSSFYSHHISTIEGGFLLTDNYRLYCNCLSLRSHGWLREQNDNSHLNKNTYNEFEKFYKFILPGFNLRPTEINAVIGLEQLKKVKKFISNRRYNAKIFYQLFKNNQSINLQQYNKESSFFAFALTLKGNLKNKRNQILKILKLLKIECRPVVSGNILSNPMLKFANYKIVGNLNVTKNIDKNGFMIGNRSSKFNKDEITILKKLTNLIT